MSDETVQEAINRLEFLVSELAKSTHSKGGIKLADFDEITHLAEYLNNRLPKKFHKLLAAGWPGTSAARATLGERLQRAILVSNQFQIRSAAPKIDDELEPTFSLEQPDKERIAHLCEQMRKIVLSSTVFDAPHKTRLLNRIAAIEKHVLADKGMFDVILGGISDVGETLGKFGTDVKPLTDRMQEVAKIARSGSQEYRQLPEPEEVKALPKPEDEIESEG